MFSNDKWRGIGVIYSRLGTCQFGNVNFHLFCKFRYRKMILGVCKILNSYFECNVTGLSKTRLILTIGPALDWMDALQPNVVYRLWPISNIVESIL